MISKLIPTAVILLLSCASLFANEQKEIESAKRQYEQSVSTNGEAARLVYVNKLAGILGDLIDDFKVTGHRKDAHYFDLLYAELKQHPAPANSDSRLLTRLRIGKWQSPRHDYLFRGDGTWSMLPIEPEVTHGHWRIVGNHYFDGINPVLTKEDEYTIILLTKTCFVFTKGADVFYETRLTK